MQDDLERLAPAGVQRHDGGLSAAEATAATEEAPAFTAPASLLEKAHTAATFSVEIQGDFPGLEAELAKEIADAKDVLEATKFGLGAGSGSAEPMGIFIYYTANFLDTTTTSRDRSRGSLQAGAEHRRRAMPGGNTVWIGSPYFYSLVRGIDTAGGAGLWIDNLRQGSFGSMENNGLLGTLLGHPAYEGIAPANASMATTEHGGDPRRPRSVRHHRPDRDEPRTHPVRLRHASGRPTSRPASAWSMHGGGTTPTASASRLSAPAAPSCIFRGK